MPLVLLASASERRRQILSEYLEDRNTCLEFCILREPEQEATSGMEVNLQVESSCIGKAMAAVKERASEGNVADIILVSDTLVEDPDDETQALGKPMNKEEALRMLLRIRGSTHKVWTATAVLENGNWKYSLEHAVVKIDYFSDDVLVELIETGSWKGKAGGYDLAGQMGKYAYLVKGSESVVLGLSIEPFKHLLRKT